VRAQPSTQLFNGSVCRGAALFDLLSPLAAAGVAGAARDL
jgi:hypothetical protein